MVEYLQMSDVNSIGFSKVKMHHGLRVKQRFNPLSGSTLPLMSKVIRR